jgi:MFS transporter, OPA family, glycerol-3-phosphate transporter
MSVLVVALCLAAVIGLYFYNNPLNHGRWFMMRRFINWLPLGMTYAFLYMGRYNLNVCKTAMGATMSNDQFGLIFAAGLWTYALSFVVNGPIVDKIGGKRGIIIAAVGAALANILLGVITYYIVTGRLKTRPLVPFALLYSLNMYFQSYGAMSIIKVKAYWFHVRERGTFGAVFGTLISIGNYFAFDWGQAIVDATRVVKSAGQQLNWVQQIFHRIFISSSSTVDATWSLFFVPAGIMIAWALVDVWLIKDTPEDAGFEYFDTHDASSGEMHIKLTTMDLLKKVFGSPLMLMLGGVEFADGVLRNGVAQWYLIFQKPLNQSEAVIFVQHWGLWLCIFGIVGGFAGGMVSDRLFRSRRGPPTAILCGLMLVMAAVMALFLYSVPRLVGLAALLIFMAVIGVTSLTSGTAAADFGGRKATATSAGIVDGFVYLGSGLQSLCLGYLTNVNWHWWPIFLMPFALFGGVLALQLWHELPAATRKYIAEVEEKSGTGQPADASQQSQVPWASEGKNRPD